MEPSDIQKLVDGMIELPRVYPDTTYTLVDSILAGKRCGSMLDVSAIPQSFIFRASNKLNPEVALAVPADDELFATASSDPLRPKIPNHCIDTSVSWTSIDSIPDDMKFDVLFGILWHTDELERALKHLKPDGIGLFHVGWNFFAPEPGGEYEGVEKSGPFGGSKGFYLQAALVNHSLLLGSMTDEYNDEYLVIVERTKKQDLFAATIPIEAEKIDELLRNLRTREQGRVLAQGFVTDVKYFQLDTFPYWEESIGYWGSLKGFESAASFVHSIDFLDPDDTTVAPNSVSVTLPNSDSMGAGKVRISFDQGMMLAEYFQLFLDELRSQREKRIVLDYGTVWAKCSSQQKEWLEGCS